MTRALTVTIAILLVVAVAAAQQRKPRVVITAGPELDDNNTLMRAIPYNSDLQIEGMVYTSSAHHWKGDGNGTTQYLAGREYTRARRGTGRLATFIDDVVRRTQEAMRT
jgi:hypothetical protein